MSAGLAEMQGVAGVPVTLRRRSGLRVESTAVITVQSGVVETAEGGGRWKELGHALLPPEPAPAAGDFLEEAGGRVWYVAGAVMSPLRDGWRCELVRYNE